MSMMVTPYAFAVAGGGGSGVNTITVAAGEVTADLTDYPVYVDMSDLTSDFWNEVASDGADIRVKDDTATDIPFDLVYFDYGGEGGVLFFKADLATAADNDFTIEVELGATAPAVTDPLGRNAVWTSFQYAIHGRENVDRTGTSGALTLVGDSAFTGGAMTFDGSGDYMRDTLAASPADYTMMAYGKIVNVLANRAIMSFMDSWATGPNRQTMALRGSTTKLAVWNPTDSWIESTVTSAANDIFTIACSNDGGATRTLYTDGTSKATNGTAATLPTSGTPELALGAEDSSVVELFIGELYLALLAPTILPAAWVAAFDTNLKTPASFYTIT